MMHSNTAVTVRGAEMKKSNFVMFLISVGASLGSGEKDSSDVSEGNNPIMSTDTPDVASDPMTTERLPNILPTHHRRLHKQHPSHFPRPTPPIPHFGFSPPPRQRIYLSDHTGNYHLSLHNFRQQQPTDFHAALGAISAHILNRGNVPYPPNRNPPHNYPPYRRTPLPTEPPAATAYEGQLKSNYYIPPTAEVDDYRPKGHQNFFYSHPLTP